jgi:hypothetical protein
MKNFNELNIAYIYNGSANPICRDAAGKFADSLGFNKCPYPSVKLGSNLVSSPNTKIIIELGWFDDEYFDYVKSIIQKDNTEYFRIVDFTYYNLNKYQLELTRMAHSSGYNDFQLRLISPYMIKYFNDITPLYIPYHYSTDEEVPISTVETYDSRYNDCIFSGFIEKDFPKSYPLRYEISKIKNSIKYLTELKHPGYSGRCWGLTESKLGNDFIKALSEHVAMVVTTGDEYLLLKYIECAEACCIPIGDFSMDMLSIMPSKLKWLHCNNIDEFTYKLNKIMSMTRSQQLDYAISYRRFVTEKYAEIKISIEYACLR